MNILLDTHILLWTLTRDNQLPQRAIELITNEKNKIYYSIASIWEVEIKNSLGKIAITGEELAEYCKEAGFELMQIREARIFKLKTLKREKNAPKHNDPFDRIMLAQSKEDDCKFITHDSLMPFYNEPCVINV